MLRLTEAEVLLGLSVPVTVGLGDHDGLPLLLMLGLLLPDGEPLGEVLREGVGVGVPVALGERVRPPDGVGVVVAEGFMVHDRLPARQSGPVCTAVGEGQIRAAIQNCRRSFKHRCFEMALCEGSSPDNQKQNCWKPFNITWHPLLKMLSHLCLASIWGYERFPCQRRGR